MEADNLFRDYSIRWFGWYRFAASAASTLYILFTTSIGLTHVKHIYTHIMHIWWIQWRPYWVWSDRKQTASSQSSAISLCIYFLAMSSLPVMIPVFGWAHRTKGQWTTFFGFLVLVTVRRYDIGKGTTLFRSIVCQYYTMTSSFQCEQHI